MMETPQEDPKVSRTGSFSKAKREAKEILGNKEKLKGLVTQAREKLESMQGTDKVWKNMINVINTFIRMIKAYINGQYKEIPWKSMLMLVAGIVYFIMPLDLIPDFIPITGFMDDLTIIIWIYRTLKIDIEAFEIWEQGLQKESS